MTTNRRFDWVSLDNSHHLGRIHEWISRVEQQLCWQLHSSVSLWILESKEHVNQVFLQRQRGKGPCLGSLCLIGEVLQRWSTQRDHRRGGTRGEHLFIHPGGWTSCWEWITWAWTGTWVHSDRCIFKLTSLWIRLFRWFRYRLDGLL